MRGRRLHRVADRSRLVLVGAHDEVTGKSPHPAASSGTSRARDVRAEFDRMKAAGAIVVKEPYGFEGYPDGDDRHARRPRRQLLPADDARWTPRPPAADDRPVPRRHDRPARADAHGRPLAARRAAGQLARHARHGRRLDAARCGRPPHLGRARRLDPARRAHPGARRGPPVRAVRPVRPRGTRRRRPPRHPDRPLRRAAYRQPAATRRARRRRATSTGSAAIPSSAT